MAPPMVARPPPLPDAAVHTDATLLGSVLGHHRYRYREPVLQRISPALAMGPADVVPHETVSRDTLSGVCDEWLVLEELERAVQVWAAHDAQCQAYAHMIM
jgi:hypothetical protein